MIPSAILGRYARSLAEVVFEENIEPNVTGDLATYSEIFRAVPDLLEVFHSPAVPREAKDKLLEELMTLYPVSPVTSNFLRILLQHNRIRFFEQIRDSYFKSVNEQQRNRLCPGNCCRTAVGEGIEGTCRPAWRYNRQNCECGVADRSGSPRRNCSSGGQHHFRRVHSNAARRDEKTSCRDVMDSKFEIRDPRLTNPISNLEF